MSKWLRMVSAALLVAVLLCACNQDADPTDRSARRTEIVSEYYNGYADLTVRIPEGWYVDSRNTTNLTDSAAASASLDRLEKADYGDGGFRIALVHLQNKRLSVDEEHSEIILYMEEYPDFEAFSDYLAYTEMYITMDTKDGYSYTLLGSEPVEVNGSEFERMTLEVNHPQNNVPYIEEYYFTQVGAKGDGIYLVAYINYWDDNEKSKEDARYMLENAFVLGEGD